MSNKTLVKSDERVEIYSYDNGYMVEASGRCVEDDYVSSKHVYFTLAEALERVTELYAMPRA